MGKHCCSSCAEGKTCESKEKVFAGSFDLKRKVDKIFENQCNKQIPSHSAASVNARSMILQLTTDISNDKKVRGHDPKGCLRVSEEEWIASYWDGVPKKLCDYDTKAKWKELVNWLFPAREDGWYTKTMRGLHQRFYDVKPFKDNQNPTIDEIENWFLEVMNLLRELLSIEEKVVFKPKLSIISRISDELEYSSSLWNGCDNPCQLSNVAKSHCGMFWDPPEKCKDKYNEMESGYCEGTDFTYDSTEVMEGWYGINPYLPWSMIFITNFYDSFIKEGMYGSHVYPFLAKPEIGFSVWYTGLESAKYRVSHSGPASSLCGKVY
jgi:hypothetical protein